MSLQISRGVDLKTAWRTADDLAENPKLKNNLSKRLFENLQSFRICCFTKRNDNLLFWAHYADAHKGYCVEYSTEGSVVAQANKVHYTDQFPSLTFPIFGDLVKQRSGQANLAGKIEGLALTKSEHWKYEEEYRSIYLLGVPKFTSKDGKSLLLNDDEITNVYFGCKMPAENRQQLIALIKQGPFNPKLWQAEIASDKFALKFEPIE